MTTPRLSVVIAAHDVDAVIGTCLAALEPQCAPHTEVIVADSSTDSTADIIRTRFPWVRLLHFDAPLTLPYLRGHGIASSRGEVIALLDPFSVAAPDWVERVCAAHAAVPNLVIGGAVDLHRPEAKSWCDWTIYFNEYALFMPPIQRGPTWIVPGSNVSYKRAALFDGAASRYAVFWKTFVNWDIERSGSPLWLADDVLVELNKPIAFGDFLRSRYFHGRCFAGMRMQQAHRGSRITRAASTVLVPLILTMRWTIGFWTKGRHRLRFALTLPGQLALFVVWAWGEAWGYLRGSGRSCEHLFY